MRRALIPLLLGLVGLPVQAVRIDDVAVNGVPFASAVNGVFPVFSAPRTNNTYWATLTGRLVFEAADMTPEMQSALDAYKVGTQKWLDQRAGYATHGGTPGVFALGSTDCSIAAGLLSNWRDRDQADALLRLSDPSRCVPMFGLGSGDTFWGWQDRRWGMGVVVERLPDADGRFQVQIPIPPATAKARFVIAYQLPDRSFGPDNGLLGSVPTTTFTTRSSWTFSGIADALINPRFAPAQSGTPYALSAHVDIFPGSLDVETKRQVFLVAGYRGRHFYKNASGQWLPYSPPTGVLEPANPELDLPASGARQTFVEGFDTSRLSSPLTLYAGYGTSADEMLGASRYGLVFEITPSPLKPTVLAVTPQTARTGVAQTYTIEGVNLDLFGGGLYAAVDDCSGGGAVTLMSATRAKFSCTHSSAGSKRGSILLSQLDTGNPFVQPTQPETLFEFQVEVSAIAPTITSISPSSAVVGTATTFTINGTDLLAGSLQVSLGDCATTVHAGSTSSGSFVCTFSSAGNKSGSISLAGTNGALFNFNVTASVGTTPSTSTPKVSGISPLVVPVGELIAYRISGTGLTGGSLRLNVTDCSNNVVTVVDDTTATVNCLHATAGIKSGTVDLVTPQGVNPLARVSISVL